MKLTTGWWKARNGSKWHVDWVGVNNASGHCAEEEVWSWTLSGKASEIGDTPLDLISPWAEPKIRPWYTVEVPVGAVLRHKNDIDVKYLILNAAEDALLVACIDSGTEGFSIHKVKLDAALKWHEHTFVGSDTWLPCGVLEEAK